ncbi:PadR family transcriptional regulator [Nakamurella silvestris]|nr:PadR family transcriptional regulator [Nakamurella silvestris]
MLVAVSATKLLTPLGIAVLGLLCEREMHPYEMYQLLVTRQRDRLIKIRTSSLYHAVDRLAEEKLVLAQGTARDGNRPERTTYEITPTGRARLDGRLRDLLATPAEEYPAFLLAIAEAHNLPGEEVVALLTRRRHTIAAMLEAEGDQVDEARRRGIAEQYLMDLGYTRAVRQAEIDWLDRTIDNLTTHQLPWPEPRTRIEPAP